ncbi:MAG: tetratricopeptide repeat protein [Elusimicrobiota bacterium]
MMSARARERIGPALVACLVAAAVLAAFAPVVLNGVLKWDDYLFIGKDLPPRGLRAAFAWSFGELHLGQYVPLAGLSHAADQWVWGENAGGHHLTSLLWHAAAGLLWYGFWFRLLTRAGTAARRENAAYAAAAASLLFCLHPLRVESVAWIAERRDVLCGFFYVAALRLYLESCLSSRGGGRWRAGALACFGLSLLSKAAGVTLPAALLILDVYPLRRLSSDPRRWGERSQRTVLLEIAPFAVLAAAFAAGTVAALQRHRMIDELASLSLGQRLSCAAYSVTFYLRKELWPFPLLPVYDMPLPFEPASPRFLAWAAAAAVVSVLAWRLSRNRPVLGAASAHYAAALLPVCGLVGGGLPHLGVDRFSYFPALAFSALAAAGVFRALSRPRWRAPVLIGTGLLLTALGAASWRRCLDWKDDETFWRAALAAAPDHREAALNLAAALGRKTQTPEAVALAERAAILAPGSAVAWENVGAVRLSRSRWADAETAFKTAAKLDPGDANARRGWSRSLLGRGRVEEALVQLRAAADADPKDAVALYELGNAWLSLGRSAPARAAFVKAAALDPALTGARVNLGLIDEGGGRDDLAAADYRAAVQAGRSPEALFNWANLESRRGRSVEALRLYGEALRLDPGFRDARFNLGNELARRGRLREAAARYREILKRRPGDAAAAENLRRVSAGR